MRLINGYTAGSVAAVAAAAAVSAGSAFGAAHAARPTITGIFPASASAGTKVMIAGTNLTGATAVTLNGLKVTFKVFSARAISASVPARAKTGKLIVVTKGGAATSKVPLSVIPFRHA